MGDEKKQEEIGNYTVREVLDILKISRATLYRLIEQGKIKRYHILKKVVFSKEEIKATIERWREEEHPAPEEKSGQGDKTGNG